MPVRIVTTDTSPVTITAAGAVPTTLRNPAPGIRTTIPLLTVRSQLGAIAASPATRPAGEITTPLRALASTERLVGITGGSSEFAERVLFPGDQVIAIELDIADPLPGPIAAWEALDAIVLDQFPEPAMTAGLLAAGTTIAVNTSGAPADRLPWERIESYWVLRYPIAGNSGVLVPDGYNPALMWNPGHPWVYRRQVMLMMAAFSIIVLAAALWRSRWVTIACVGISVLGVLSIVAWRRGQSPHDGGEWRHHHHV